MATKKDKQRGLRKANSRTLRSAAQQTPAGVALLLMEAFTNLKKAQLVALYAAISLLTAYIQNYLEGRANKHLLEEPTSDSPGTSYKPES